MVNYPEETMFQEEGGVAVRMSLPLLPVVRSLGPQPDAYQERGQPEQHAHKRLGLPARQQHIADEEEAEHQHQRGQQPVEAAARVNRKAGRKGRRAEERQQRPGQRGTGQALPPGELPDSPQTEHGEGGGLDGEHIGRKKPPVAPPGIEE